MRRTATILTALSLFVAATGCSSFGKLFGKKSDPYADYYAADPAATTGTGTTADQYPAYEPASSYPSMASTYGNGGGRVHTVAKKETLYSIARTYYNGDHHRWRDIYEANRADISDPNRIRVGQKLVIP